MHAWYSADCTNVLKKATFASIVCIRYRMVWYYSSFASKPMKIDERYGFITICWQWDQSTYLLISAIRSQLVEFFSEVAILTFIFLLFHEIFMKNSCYNCDKIEEISRENEIT